MSFGKFILTIIIGTIVSLASFLTVIFFSVPQTDSWQILLFYLSFFSLWIGIIFLLGLGLRIKLGRDTFYFNYINIAFRQALFFSALLAACVFLQGMRLFTWWNFLFLILAILFLEFFALSRRFRALKV